MFIGSSSLRPICGEGSNCHGKPTRAILPNPAIIASTNEFFLNNPPFSPTVSHTSSPLNAYKEIYSAVLPPTHNRFPEEDPVSKIDLVHAHECADHFGKCSLNDIETMEQALHAERIQTSFLGNDHILLNPSELLDHYQLEQKLSQQLDHDTDKVNAWSELSQISDKMSGNVAMMISTNPMNQNPKDGFFAASVAFMHRLNAIPGLVEMLALVLIWFLLPKPLFE